MNGLALCAGVGGLELGLGLAIGERYRTVGYVEREAFAASVLVARMEDKILDKAPIWDYLNWFPSGAYSGKVDIISAGFPCQPWSFAGKRQGLKDERWLWPNIFSIICDVGPGLVFLENVPGLLIGGIGSVLGDLAKAGFDAEWGCYTAAGLGAPHRRERIFVLGYTAGARLEGPKQWVEPRASHPFPPHPGDHEGWSRYNDPKPAVRRGSDGLANQVDRLRVCGNGVVPLEAAYAFRTLAARIIHR